MRDKFYPPGEGDMNRRQQFAQLSDAEKAQELARLEERARMENAATFIEEFEREQDPVKKKMLRDAMDIARAVEAEGGQALVVGGYVRDTVLRRTGYAVEPKDIDIEVYGIDFEKLKTILGQFGTPNVQGASFAVIKLNGLDISIPRRDSKSGLGHKDFVIEGDPNMTVPDAARRRDFTVNSMGLNPATGEIIDPFGGIDDIGRKVLRATDAKYFGDDPLRVLRAMQFSARFDFTVDEETAELCRSLDLSHLPRERIGEEWQKLLLKSARPSVGLEMARELKVIEKLHPELLALEGVPQETEWHPEGDVWNHTKLVADAAAGIVRREKLEDRESLTVMLAALCHDLGKPATTVRNDKGRITSYGHSEAGIEPTRSFLHKLRMPDEVTSEVSALVKEHLFPALHKDASEAAVRRLAHRLEPASIKQLVLVAEADHGGRGIPLESFPEGADLLDKAQKNSVDYAKPEKILMGRHMLELGMKESKDVGKIVKRVYQLQLDGVVKDIESAKRFGELYRTIGEVEGKEIEPLKLLNGEAMTKEDMIRFIEERFMDGSAHDMGTLTMLYILQGKPLPACVEENQAAILTAHKYGPVWFSHFNREFYEKPWKSFYGTFEVDDASRKMLVELPHVEQETAAEKLINEPDEHSIEMYNESFNIEPAEAEGQIALYVTNKYPYEAGLMDGYRVMVGFDPEKKRISISVLNEDMDKVREIDGRIRRILPEFAKAKRMGYLFAADSEDRDNVFTEADARRIYAALQKDLGETGNKQ